MADGSGERAEAAVLGQSPLQRGGGSWLVGSPVRTAGSGGGVCAAACGRLWLEAG